MEYTGIKWHSRVFLGFYAGRPCMTKEERLCTSERNKKLSMTVGSEGGRSVFRTDEASQKQNVNPSNPT